MAKHVQSFIRPQAPDHKAQPTLLFTASNGPCSHPLHRYWRGLRNSIKTPWSGLNPLFNLLLVLTALQSLDQILHLEIDSDGILNEILGGRHVGGCFLLGIEVFDLCLELVSVWVCIVHACCWSMIDTPEGGDALGFPLHISHDEIFEGIECEGNMGESARGWVLGTDARNLSNCDAVVLVVVGEKRQKVILVARLCAEELLIEVYHLGELCGLENDMGEFGGFDRFGGRIVEVDGHFEVVEGITVRYEEVDL